VTGSCSVGRSVLDEEGALVESAQSERAEVNLPFAVVDLDEGADGREEGAHYFPAVA
jgi:hypothetical protein